MNFFENLVRTLSWSFIHSLWQGLILAMLAGIVMLLTRKAAASLRYGLLCSLFFLFLAGFAVTFAIEWHSPEYQSSFFAGTQLDQTGFFDQSLFIPVVENFSAILDRNAVWIVLIWMIVLSYKAFRMIMAMTYVHQLRRSHISNAATEWQAKLLLLSQQLGISKKVALVESALVNIPIVIGHLKPIILVPIGILAQLPAGEVEAVLLHELAHIRRHDYFVNFIQRVAELILFFNPALLWVSQLMRIEREHCCDDIAIVKTKNKKQYINALISFKEYSMKPSPYAIGFLGKRNLLLQRMSRLIYNRNRALSRMELAFFAINIVVFMFFTAMIVKPKVNTPTATALPVATVHSITGLSTPSSEPQTLLIKDKHAGALTSKHSTAVKTSVAEISPKNHPDQQPVYTEQIQSVYRAIPPVALTVAERVRQQADKDRAQAALDREKADLDRQQADKDRAQAELDRQQAARDRAIADEHRKKAELDRKQADKDRAQAELDRQKADFDRQHMERTVYP